MTSQKFNKLLQACDNFAKLAVPDYNKAIQGYKAVIQNEIAAGIAAINYLTTSNKDAANSQALTSLDEVFGNLGATNNLLNELNGADIAVRDMLAIIGRGLFYTSPSNTGTGYDPITRQGGTNSPGAHLDQIYGLLKKLDAYVKSIKI